MFVLLVLSGVFFTSFFLFKDTVVSISIKFYCEVVCELKTKKSKSSLLDNVLAVLGFTYDFDCEECGDSEELTRLNLVIPKEEDYFDAGEETEEYDISHILAS